MAETAEVKDDKPKSKDAEGEIATANGSQPTIKSSEENPFLAPADKFWSVDRDGAVKLRVGTTEYDKDTPITVHEVFRQIVEKAGNYVAPCSKTQWSVAEVDLRPVHERLQDRCQRFY